MKTSPSHTKTEINVQIKINSSVLKVVKIMKRIKVSGNFTGGFLVIAHVSGRRDYMLHDRFITVLSEW